MIDRVAASLGTRLVEVPVGFKWFVPGLLDGSVGFGGEESAGASFLRRDGRVWTTDKDGIILDLLAAEMLAVSGPPRASSTLELDSAHGDPAYARVDAPGRPGAEGGARGPVPRPGLRDRGWPANRSPTSSPTHPERRQARRPEGDHRDGLVRGTPAGTEDVYKIYAECFRGPDHLAQVQAAAREVVSAALG